MKTALQPIEHLGRFERLQLVEDIWDEFASETDPETRADVLDELARRAAWRDAHPGQGKSLAQIAQSLGVHL
ncbi:MAG: addiction module protein [Polaromonas sp.]|uniref:addiction module protein n=1 Tax=Polaromonas sp. TaxID=1869339 RepID=UPI00272FAE28|nr:addiction module protein [Polaromonas sp.]MDP2254442.1 addiction module protein [Polaromonas sp.]